MFGDIYGGWIAIDLGLLRTLALLSLFVSMLLVGLLVRRRAWHEYVSLVTATVTILFVLGLVLLQIVFDYPVVVERDFFPIR